VLPMNSGAEAVETAVKAVRKWGYEVKGVAENKAEIIVCSNNFHGRTMGIVGFSTDPDARSGFGPFAPGFITVPFGDIDAFRAAINENTVAFLIEPIQGEAGVVIPPQGYFPEVRALCSKHGVTLILDEIQTGLGRTGKLLAEEHEGIEADVTLIGKALSGGFYPVSAVLSNSEVLGVLKPGQHGSTFGGNPLAMAVGNAVLDIILADGFLDHVRKSGLALKQRLARLKDEHPTIIEDVRGEGLMMGLKCKVPNTEFVTAALGEKMLVIGAGDNVVRLLPPLIVSDSDISDAANRLDRACRTLEAKHA
jgi:ornithine--oxo-acid transaminase